MRVVAGSARGRRLMVPRGADVRPTSDRVREALFAILGDRVVGARVLDLYCGSGALAVEALSRGAATAVLVDRAPAAVAAARANLERAGVAHRATVVRGRAESVAARDPGEPFDLVFLDPPYAASLDSVDAVVRALRQGRSLRDASLLVVERPAGGEETSSLGTLPVIDTRRYGTTRLLFLSVEDDK